MFWGIIAMLTQNRTRTVVQHHDDHQYLQHHHHPRTILYHQHYHNFQNHTFQDLKSSGPFCSQYYNPKCRYCAFCFLVPASLYFIVAWGVIRFIHH